MTFVEIFEDLMRGNPVTRTAWAEDENRMMYYCSKEKTFVDRWGDEPCQAQHKFICVTHEDMSADDWEVCEWEGEEDEISSK
jgi:hypothetical protein